MTGREEENGEGIVDGREVTEDKTGEIDDGEDAGRDELGVGVG